MTEILAYYCAAGSPRKGVCWHSVSIQKHDYSFEEICCFPGWPEESDWIKLAKIILEHHRSHPVSDIQAELLYRWPGHSLMRLTLEDLNEFWKTHCSQQDLFGGLNDHNPA